MHQTDAAPTGIGPILSIAKKDFKIEGRARAVLVSTVFFAGMVILILVFAFAARAQDDTRLREALQFVGPGVLWVAVVFSSVLAASRAFGSEAEDGALDALLLYPVAHEYVYLGKLLSTAVALLFLAAIITPIWVVLYQLVVLNWPLLLLTVILGCVGFAIIASFQSALTVNLRARESLMPLLVFPFVVPVVLSAVQATSVLVAAPLVPGMLIQQDVGAATRWLQLLFGVDVIYLVVCTLVFPFVVEG